MELFLSCGKAFVIGGILCAIGQILIDYTKLTPARILVSYVVAGVILGAVGLYAPIAEWGRRRDRPADRLRIQSCKRRKRSR